jgi:hypothetical protein
VHNLSKDHWFWRSKRKKNISTARSWTENYYQNALQRFWIPPEDYCATALAGDVVSGGYLCIRTREKPNLANSDAPRLRQTPSLASWFVGWSCSSMAGGQNTVCLQLRAVMCLWHIGVCLRWKQAMEHCFNDINHTDWSPGCPTRCVTRTHTHTHTRTHARARARSHTHTHTVGQQWRLDVWPCVRTPF